MNLSDPLECVILGKYYKGDIRMFHKIKSVTALNNYQLFVQFCDGVTKGFDVKPLFDRWEPLRALETIPGLFVACRWTRVATASPGTTIWIFPARSCGKMVSLEHKTKNSPRPHRPGVCCVYLIVIFCPGWMRFGFAIPFTCASFCQVVP